MFSSKKSSNSEAAAQVPSMPSASGAQGKRAVRSTAAPSLISADLVVNGTLTSTGDIQIDGRVEGDVQSAGLVIGEKAFIHGEVLAEDVTVRGRVQGSIRARKVLLAATCHVEGNILHEAFAVEAGAFFEGNCRHADNPLSDEYKQGGSLAKPAPAAPISAAVMAPALSVPPAADAPRPAMAATVAPLKTGA